MQPIQNCRMKSFGLSILNNSNKILSKAQLSKGGTLNVDVRLVFKNALEMEQLD
jgi:DNA repair protein RadC